MVNETDALCATLGDKVMEFQQRNGMYRLYLAPNSLHLVTDYISLGVKLCLEGDVTHLLHEFVWVCSDRFYHGDYGQWYQPGEPQFYGHERGLYVCPFGNLMMCRNGSYVTTCFLYEL